MSKKNGLIQGPYVMHRAEMLKSAAWRSIRSTAAKQILDRLEIEHMRHAGKNNGRLICTYDDLVAYGIRRMSIGPAIRLLVVAGLLIITQQGRGDDGYHIPTMYALTYLPIDGIAPTDEWRNYLPNTVQGTMCDLDAALKKTGKSPKKSKKRVAKTIPAAGSESATRTGIESATQGADSAGIESATTFYTSSTHLPASEQRLVEEKQKSESLEACTELPAAPINLDLPDFLRRGHPDCWVK